MLGDVEKKKAKTVTRSIALMQAGEVQNTYSQETVQQLVEKVDAPNITKDTIQTELMKESVKNEVLHSVLSA